MDLKANQIKIALGSASKNAIAILKALDCFITLTLFQTATVQINLNPILQYS